MQTLKQLSLWLLLLPFGLFAQQTLQGTVVDDTGIPIPGAEILVEGTNRGTSTDFDGNFTIEVNNGETIRIKYLGYKTQTIKFSGQSNLSIQLETDDDVLEEVVLIGYGTSRKKDITGSVTTVTEEDFTKGNIVTAENLIQGRVAGVNITTGGEPGAGSAIRIRGGGSLSANNDPLIVLDGLPLSNQTAGGSRSILASINPNDIESFTVLKDASATAIYGNRASAGVIIIETKKGSKKFNVDYNYTGGVYTLFNELDVFNGDEFRALIADKRPNDLPKLGNANTNWQREIYRTAISADHNVSIRGQLFNRIPTRLSAGHIDQEGLRLTEEFQRSSVSVAMNPTFFKDHLRINLNANASLQKNRFSPGVEGAAIRFDPTQPVFLNNSPFGGFFEYFNPNSPQGNEPLNGTRNPVATILQQENRTEASRIFGNFNADYRFHFLPELRAVVNLGMDIESGSGFFIQDAQSINGFRDPQTLQFLGAESNFTNDVRNYLADGYLNYKRDITRGFNADLTAGYSYQRFETKSFNSGNIRSTLDSEVPISFEEPDLVLVAYFARGIFNFDDKYVLTTSYRRDGSSRFAKDFRWGNFFSGAFAWNILEEDFAKNTTTFSDLKFRVGVGQTGQQEIFRRDIYFEQYGQSFPNSQYMFGNTPINVGLPFSRNTFAQWEVATTYNAGVDFGIFGNRLTGAVDAYYRRTEDLFIFSRIPDGSNFSNAFDQNAGNLDTKGLEIGLNGVIFDARGDRDKFDWNVNYNVTFMDQEIIDLANGQEIRVGGIEGGTGNNIQINAAGLAPNSFFVFNQIYDANGMPIEGAYADLNGDNVINDDDRYAYRNPMPDVTMGFQSTMRYKDFDFTFNLRASFGNYNYNNVNSSRAQFNFLQDNQVVGNIPRSVLNTNFNNQADVILSDIYLEDASFLRMDNIQLGYTFRDFFNKGNNFRLWAGIQNAFVITNYSGLDPEIFGGIDNTIFPRPRTFLFGANVNF